MTKKERNILEQTFKCLVQERIRKEINNNDYCVCYTDETDANKLNLEKPYDVFNKDDIDYLRVCKLVFAIFKAGYDDIYYVVCNVSMYGYIHCHFYDFNGEYLDIRQTL